MRRKGRSLKKIIHINPTAVKSKIIINPENNLIIQKPDCPTAPLENGGTNLEKKLHCDKSDTYRCLLPSKSGPWEIKVKAIPGTI